MGLNDTWPVIYLRGYAGDQKGVEQTVDDPFYGFNAGSTHVRVGPTGAATFYAFEGSVIRLMTDHGYQDAYSDGVQEVPDGADPQHERWRTVWIHRYYDDTSETFDPKKDPDRWSIERAAEDLANLIDVVLATTGAPRVYLVGHSTGGLIIRSLLQRHYPSGTAQDVVAKVFTYGTPHGGIHFGNPAGPSMEWLRDRFGWNNVADFGRQRMYEYLTPGAKHGDPPPPTFDPQYLPPDAFPPERFFCLVGTDAGDYGLPRRVVGPQSDGLVQIGSAYVYGSPRAYVHRAHSGRYGIVNSESGYANLERFFFGDVRVQLSLEALSAIPHRVDAGADAFHQADVTVSLRGLPVVLHEQTSEHFCPVPLEWKEGHEGEPIALFSLFLVPERAVDERLRYAVSLAVYRIERRDSGLWRRDHLEKIPLWTDNLVVDLIPNAAHAFDARYDWRGETTDPRRPPERALDLHDNGDGTTTARIPLPQPARAVLGPEAALLVEAGWWRPFAR
jgi:pimeloyl-ACP methyl ester carboxylesterase